MQKHIRNIYIRKHIRNIYIEKHIRNIYIGKHIRNICRWKHIRKDMFMFKKNSFCFILSVTFYFDCTTLVWATHLSIFLSFFHLFFFFFILFVESVTLLGMRFDNKLLHLHDYFDLIITKGKRWSFSGLGSSYSKSPR